MSNVRQYNGTTHICYNCMTGEYRAGRVKPRGRDWCEPYEISHEDLDFIENGVDHE